MNHITKVQSDVSSSFDAIYGFKTRHKRRGCMQYISNKAPNICEAMAGTGTYRYSWSKHFGVHVGSTDNLPVRHALPSTSVGCFLTPNAARAG